VWTGTTMIVWGGAVSSTGNASGGAAYDPANGTWTAISATGAPSDRRDHSAVWTGSKMIVWGGTDITEGDGMADGGIYDPANDTWTALPDTGAPEARFGHSAVWTGTKMIVWGGATSSTDSLDDGAAYDPSTGAWTPISNTHAPTARRDHSAVWTGSEMIVWGGSSISAGDPDADTLAYTPATDSWAALATTNAPDPRFGHAATWTGDAMFVWGGADSSTDTFDDGAQLDPASGVWTALPSDGAPSARRKLTAVWDGSAILLWGGSTILDGGTDYDTGAVFGVFQ
jgi:N-acetylneuraminic acid mutarotase